MKRLKNMFDYIFITNLPSFYKLNLYNEIAKKLMICVIFVGSGSNIRTGDFATGEINFTYYFLSAENFEGRNVFKSSLKLFFILRKIKFKKIVVGGWDLLEFWLIAILNSKRKNALALESGVTDSTHGGIKGIIKKLFLARINTVFASGLSQAELLEKLNYQRRVYITKGVGIINKPQFIKDNYDFNNNFLYIGRLSAEKNLDLLIEAFNELPQFKLNIVGNGGLEPELKKIANPNVNFIGYVDNKDISKIFLENNIFILPSLSEPWGLVIEEALYFKLPVIISDRVGCGSELVKNRENGIIFNASSIEALKSSISEMSKNYPAYYHNTMNFDLNKKDEEQVDCYLKALLIG